MRDGRGEQLVTCLLGREKRAIACSIKKVCTCAWSFPMSVQHRSCWRRGRRLALVAVNRVLSAACCPIACGQFIGRSKGDANHVCGPSSDATNCFFSCPSSGVCFSLHLVGVYLCPELAS